MTHAPTAGAWRASPLRQSQPSWPFDWTAEVTTMDGKARSHRYVASIRQSSSCPFAEAQANLRVMAEAANMLGVLRVAAHVLDMSNPEHVVFADSAADCLDALLREEGAIRQILRRIDGSKIIAAT
jgi:hypothetical protein